MLKVLLMYIMFAIILFILSNYIKSKSKSINNDIIFPLVYLVLVSALLESNNISYNYIFLIIVFSMLIEIFYNYLYKNNRMLFNMKYFLNINVLLIILSVLLESTIIKGVDSILPSMDNIKVLLWIFICIYLYSLVKDIIPSAKRKENESALDNREYVLNSYTKYKIKYNDTLKGYNLVVKDLIYSYMIYEGYNTTRLRRKIDNFFFGKINKVSKLGIMQVSSKAFITDEESIRLVGNKLQNIYEKNKNKDYNNILDTYEKTKEKKEKIVNIYKYIEEFKALN